MSPEPQTQTNGAPSPPAEAAPKVEAAVSLELLKYKEELAEKMGLPSTYAMGILKQVCTDLVESGFAPAHFKNNPMALYLAALRGREMGLGPLESITETFWAAPGGRLGLFSNKALQIMHKNGVLSEILTETKDKCEILFTPPPPHKPYTASFDLTEAVTAGLVKPDSNWLRWPKDMNKARAIGRGWRVMSGTFKNGGANLYLKEEIEDMPDYVPAQSDIPEGQPVVEVQAGRRKKADAPAPEAAPAPVAVAPTKVSETFHIGYALEPDQSNYDTACLRAQAIANEKKVPVEVTRVTSFSDNTMVEVSVGVFKPPAEMPSQKPPVAPVAPPQAAPATPAPSPAPATTAPVQQVDTAKEEVIARARAAYALIPGEEKLRKQIGDMFCSGFYGVSVPKEWPRNIEDRTKGVEALEFAIKNDMARLISSPVTARDFGRELAAKADKGPADSKPATPAPDPSAGLYRKLNWSPETCAVAAKFKSKFGIEPQDLEDYIASLKIDALPDQDARGYMAVGAVVGRTYKAEGGTDQYPMKTLFALGEKGAGSYSDIVKALEMFNERPLEEIAPAKLVADLTKMLTRLAPEPVQTASAGDGWE